MEVLSSNIQKLRDQIAELEADRFGLLKNNQTGDKNVEIAILDNEIMMLEMKLESEMAQYDELAKFIEYQTCCNHVFVEDLVDIDPDRSMTINYCVHCFLTT
jgi:predicted RNase H-like nuclease (RuvC/YqgF family)